MSDLTLPLIGLTTLVGYFFSKNGKNPRQQEIRRNTVEAFDKPNGSNIYESNIVEEANKEILERSLENYKLAENPSKTGLIKPLFNTYSAVGNENIMSIELNAEGNMTGVDSKTLGKLNDLNRLGKQEKINIETQPMFKTGNILDVTGYSDLENDEKINNLTGLPYDVSHMNMIPFFGGSIKQNIETFSNESLLENRSGKTSTFKHKQEINSLYDKQPENIYGNKAFTTQVDIDRYIPSLYRQNERPIDQEYVAAPISGTIDNPINPKVGAKTVDELRVLSKQKETYNGRTIAGQFGNVRGIEGEVVKRRPDTYYEQETPENLFRGPGAYVQHTMDEDYKTNLKNSSRQDYNIEYYGTANNSQLNKTKQRLGTIDNSSELELSLFQNPKRQNFEGDYIRNVSLTDKKVDDYGKSGITVYESERTTTGIQSQLLNAQNKEFGISIRPQDDFKKTLREDAMKYDNIGNIKTTFDSGKISAYESGLLGVDAKITQKQSLVDNKYVGGVEKERGMGYLVTKYDARTTGKEMLTDKGDYRGSAKFNSESESRHKYKNAEIRDNKQKVLMGERPNGPQYFQTASGKVSQADIKSTRNMLLKEREDTRDKMNVNTNQVIPSKELIGANLRYREDNGRVDKVSSERLDPSILKQLNENPFIIKQ